MSKKKLSRDNIGRKQRRLAHREFFFRYVEILNPISDSSGKLSKLSLYNFKLQIGSLFLIFKE